jgi:hypothetical protein
VNANFSNGPAKLRKSTVIEVNEGPKAIGIAANDGNHQRQIVVRGANDRFRAAADANPGLERTGFDGRKDGLFVEGRARLTSPGDGFVF